MAISWVFVEHQRLCGESYRWVTTSPLSILSAGFLCRRLPSHKTPNATDFPSSNCGPGSICANPFLPDVDHCRTKAINLVFKRKTQPNTTFSSSIDEWLPIDMSTIASRMATINCAFSQTNIENAGRCHNRRPSQQSHYQKNESNDDDDDEKQTKINFHKSNLWYFYSHFVTILFYWLSVAAWHCRRWPIKIEIFRLR